MKWEYKLAVFELYQGYSGSAGPEEAIRELNQYGSEGWEAIGFVPMRAERAMFCFVFLKRAKPD